MLFVTQAWLSNMFNSEIQIKCSLERAHTAKSIWFVFQSWTCCWLWVCVHRVVVQLGRPQNRYRRVQHQHHCGFNSIVLGTMAAEFKNTVNIAGRLDVSKIRRKKRQIKPIDNHLVSVVTYYMGKTVEKGHYTAIARNSKIKYFQNDINTVQEKKHWRREHICCSLNEKQNTWTNKTYDSAVW